MSVAIRPSLLRKASAAAAGALVAGMLVAPSGAQAAPPSPSGAGTLKLGKQGSISDPEAVLGAGWKNSSDVLVTGVGDTNGFHLYVAKEKSAFAWSTLATLRASSLEMGAWTGEVCVTGSGRYAAAVFAPSAAANKPKLLQSGAFAAVVDIQTGAARTVATGVQLAYFNPGCGPDDRVLITRSLGLEGEETDLLAVDAATATVTGTRRIKAQFTSPAPAPDGDYGVVGGDLVKVDAAGSLHGVGRPAGTPFAVHATVKHGVDVASVNNEVVSVQRFSGGSVTSLGSGVRGKLQLFGLRGGASAVVGDPKGVKDAPELTRLSSDERVQALSAKGHLLAKSLLPRQAADAAGSPLSRVDPERAGAVAIKVRATRSQRDAAGSITTDPAPSLDALPTSQPAPTMMVAEEDDWTVTLPKCAIPRNDPSAQALQVSPNMVEWAVDQAVHGRLMVQRPANYLKTAKPAYQPQVMFRKHDLAGGGQVPAQIMLGILAQETNLSQASWHAAVGDLGNPLIANYYGTASIDSINYAKADCGYGIGQVTTGMAALNTDEVYSHDQQVAIATDYAANIAAAMNILIDKWNQLYEEPEGRLWVNDGDPKYIENWFLAVWAYNSGYYPSSDTWKSPNNGHFGVGWLNNPANPQYDASRKPFLRDEHYEDAIVPSHWSYPERIMGWVETPQLKGMPADDAYQKPNYGSYSGDKVTNPSDYQSNYIFCSQDNACNPEDKKNPCPAVDSSCWWSGMAEFANCPIQCATEKLGYPLGSAEPALQRYWDTACATLTGGRDSYRDTSKPVLTVYDLNDTEKYALGCDVPKSDGKFSLRMGEPSGQTGALYAPIDLHQLGAGYKGHMWFTHVYPNDWAGGAIDGYSEPKHKITATWTPDLFSRGTQRYDVLVSLPSHGANYTEADYVVWNSGLDLKEDVCPINQDSTGWFGGGTDFWQYIGAYDLSPGARVQLTNIGGENEDGSVDIAFDAIAFIPITGEGHKCGVQYGN